MFVQQVKPPSSDAPAKKELRRIDGERFTLYNPIAEEFGQPNKIDSMQMNSIVPETNR